MVVARTVLLGIAIGLAGCAAPAARAQDLSEHFGISIGAPVYNNQVTFTEQVARHLHDMGVRWIRVEFIASGDTIPYPWYDEIINRANAYDLEVLGLLTYQTKYYYGDSSFWAEDWWQDSFRDRCIEVVDHYKDFPSGPIKFWEVWNEPDSLGGMPAAKFGRMMAITYPAIKAADHEATVILGGLTGFWTPTYTYMQQVYDSTYFQDYHAAHGIYPFDILGQHPYHWTWDPDNYLDYYMNAYYGMARLLRLYGDGYKRIWFTEYGWNSSPTAHSSVNPGGEPSYNEWLQADYFEHAFDITQALSYGDDFGPYVEKTFLFCYKDFDLGSPETREYFGTVDESHTRKPLFYRYRGMTSDALENAALSATVTASNELPPYEVAAYACDGTPFTKWTALSPADDHLLTLDLGDWYVVHEFRVSHAELNHEPDHYNTTAFTIQTAPAASGPWTTLLDVSNTNREPVNLLPLENPALMRHVRLHITDACEADGIARLPEFEVWGTPAADPAGIETEYEFASDVPGLSRDVADNDLLHGRLAAFESGDVDPDNDVYAYDFSSSLCLQVQWDSPVPGFWHGYGDPSPAAHLPAFTDGASDPGVVLRDFAQAANVLRYDFDQPTDLRELVVFAANAGADGRVFQHYDVYVSTDGGASFAPLVRGVKAGEFGDENAGTYGASYTRVHAPVAGTLVTSATNLRLVFYDVTHGDTFLDPYQGKFNETQGYQNNCPDTQAQDLDGRQKAFGAPVIVEIDVFARRSGDANSDGVVNASDWPAIADCLTGPGNPCDEFPCRPFDFPTRDSDVDLADLAGLQQALE